MAVYKKIKRCCGFTFIEIVAIVAIIAICLTIFRVTYFRDDKIKANLAHEELALLNCAIEVFKLGNGHYPVCASQSVEDSAKELYSTLSNMGDSFADRHKWSVLEGKILDPWGNPYVYRCKSEDDVLYKLFSMGPNKHIDEGELIDDIYSR